MRRVQINHRAWSVYTLYIYMYVYYVKYHCGSKYMQHKHTHTHTDVKKHEYIYMNGCEYSGKLSLFPEQVEKI